MPRLGISRAVPQAARRVAAAALPRAQRRHGPAELGSLLSHGRSRAEVAASGTSWLPLRKRALGRGRAVDGRALRRQRRTGRDLSADDLEHHRAAAAWAMRDDSPEMKYCHEHLRRADDRRRRHDSLAAVQVAGVGHGDHAAGTWPPAGCRADASGDRAGRRVAARSQKSAAAAIGAKRSPPSRAAGASSMPTSSIPTSTTRSWS